MHYITRNLLAAAALAFLFGCASTSENTAGQETGVQQDATAQEGLIGQPGGEAQSYAYGQAPSQYDAYDTTGGTTGAPPSTWGVGQPVAGGGTVSADRIVYFAFDSADIPAEGQAVVVANARSLMGNRQIITQLEGHTDEQGSREYNIALGERRANAVRQAMIATGVAPQQIRVVSYGEERPASSGQSEESYALNRRVEIMY